MSETESKAVRRGCQSPGAAHRPTQLPQVSRFLLRGFRWYVPRYLRRHFNAVRVARDCVPQIPEDHAVICFANHPGWWDPLVAIYLNLRCLGGRTFYAPIDQSALQEYPVFGRLGFYGIDLNSMSGARRFLAVSRGLLQDANSAVWMTPGGRFSDPRERTVFEPGLSHLATMVPRVTLIPVAFEYPFWEQRTPEALVQFGAPLESQSRALSKAEWHRELEEQLAETQARLAEKAISRDPSEFESWLKGAAGVGGGYDFFRRLRGLLTGSGFDPRHGASKRERPEDHRS